MPRHHALVEIENRQRREVEQQKFNKLQADDSRLSLVAKWQSRGDGVVSQKDLMRHLDRVQAQHNDSLQSRRQRLADLLLRESASHEAMLSHLAETDEQRRERLLQKARDLRAQQEEEQRVELQKRHERLFRDKIDSLRLAESRLKVMQVADARYDQLALADRRRAEQRREDAFFAQQRDEAARLACERAQRDLEDAHVLKQRLRAGLAAQVTGNAQRAAEAREAEARERAAFNAQVAAEAAEAAARRREEAERRAGLMEEMRVFTEEMRRARRQEYERLCKEDREALDRILAQVAADEAREAQQRRDQREENRAYLAEVRAQADTRREDEAHLDKLWDEASAREWERRETHWRADQRRRDDLLRSVLIARRQQVLEQRQREREDKETLRRENEEFRRAIENTRDVDAEERARRFALLKENQKYLEMQIQRRADEREAEKQAQREEQSVQDALESQYAERIKVEMDNLERAKPERYKDVPLLPRQRQKPF